MVLFTTEGCSYCAEFIRRSLGDPGLASLVQAHFDAVGLEIFSDAEMVDPSGNETRVKQFAEDAKASGLVARAADRAGLRGTVNP